MQTILGASGTVGTELAKALSKHTDKIRIVSRNPKKANPNDELFPADLTNSEQIDKAVEGSEIVYVTIGFDYKTKVWQQSWMPFITKVIESCKKHKAKLVFFDNVYMYDQSEIPHMTESSKINPSSKKGKVRAEIVEAIMNEVKVGKLTALIARSADFYGPKSDKSMFYLGVESLKNGKPFDWIASTDKIHNFTYTPDAGRATALLGNTPDAFNEVWHLPTIQEKLTGKQWIDLVGNEMGITPKVRVMPIWMMRILGVFIPILGELKEMAYQFGNDYFFDSSKFNQRFPDFKTTSIEEGIKATVNSLSK
jgi:nucleoside-diphosphate-sugar epimerase